MAAKLPFLIVSEEKEIVGGLESLIEKIFPTAVVIVRDSGVDALKFISELNKLQIIICAVNIRGINGFQLLSKLKGDSKLKEHYFISLTGDANKEMNLKSIKLGADNFLNTPLEIDQLIAILKIAVNNIELKNRLISEKNKFRMALEELQKTSDKATDMIKDFQNARMPDWEKSLVKIEKAAVWLAEEIELSEDEIHNIKIAAALINVGKLLIPEKLLRHNVMVNGQVKNDELAEIPINAYELMTQLRGYEGAAELLKHVYENFDGSGIPENLIGTQIAKGARILRVCLEYEEFSRKGKAVSKIIDELMISARRVYDHKVVAYYEQYIATYGLDNSTTVEVPVEPRDIKPGMMVTRNIVSDSGIKLLAAGSNLDIEKVEKVLSIHNGDPVIGKIYVKKM
jgi:response regulator RpfG family c-di-GMP phosphodiesterase